MQRLFTVALMCLIGGSLLGCEARGRIGDPEPAAGEVRYRETETVRETDGQVRTRTEIRREVD